MDANELLYEQEKLDDNFYTTPNIEIKELPLTESVRDSSMGFDNLALILIIYTITVILLSFNFERLKTGTKKLFFLVQYSKIPCYNCRFFHDNPYVKCAIHPTIAFSKQAFNCIDYCSK
ncbi:MAG: hypothetical protein ACRC2R_22995 [Xenococcaceae cyanobacterium]